ncbi:MAG: sigma-70 family RNA polymerase sigma factor [Lacipirellulaceae bacterium]
MNALLEKSVAKLALSEATLPTEVELERIRFEAFVREHQANIWRYLRYLGADSNDAEDLVQETFLAFRRADYEERSPQETAGYLRKVARNQLLMWRRASGTKINTVDLANAEQAWAEMTEPNGYEGLLALLKDCLQSVEGRAREAINKFYEEGQSREAVAESLGMKSNGVKTLLRRTRDALRACIERKQRE